MQQAPLVPSRHSASGSVSTTFFRVCAAKATERQAKNTKYLLVIAKMYCQQWIQLDQIQKFMNNRLFSQPSKNKIQQSMRQDDAEQYSIYDESAGQSNLDPEEEISDSSFELEADMKESTEQDKKNIEKLLDRLGLNTAQSAIKKNQQLQLVVNNFVQNCIETVDHTANIEDYDQQYDSAYQQKLKNHEPYLSSIYISELTQLQTVQAIPDTPLRSIYKNTLLICRYISMSCERIIQHPIFEAFILLIIMLNSLKMATDDPLSSTTQLPWAETTFTAIYVIEMCLKIMALGFVINKGSYLRDMWNIMDFCIVVTSILPLAINLNFSVSALRAFRVLRPLRTITKIKALKQIMKTLFYSFSLVMDSIYILMFVIFVLAIAGMQLFGGHLKYVCMAKQTGVLTKSLCELDSDCQSQQMCVKGIASPNFSVMNFDTLIWSSLSVFQSITLEGWSAIMQSVQMANGFVYCIYSLLIVFICEYVLLNMTLAILKYKYAQVKDNLIEEEEQEKQQYEPSFLKKIGIYQDISVLSRSPLLVRANNPSKKQVGCSRSLPIKDSVPTVSVKELIEYLYQSKTSQKVLDPQKQEINIQQLRQIGRLSDFKWDARQLEFEQNILSEKLIEVEHFRERNESDKTIEGKQEEQQSLLHDSFDSNIEEMLQSESDEEEMERQQELAQIALNAQEKMNRLSNNSQDINNNNPKSIEEPKDKPVQLKPNKPLREISQLDRLLSLIGGKPGVSHNQQLEAIIPEVDLKQIESERIFERFADLGDYSLKRANKLNELKDLDIQAAKKSKPKQIKPKKMPIQAVIDEAVLDLNELHLKNELQKKKLRCRIKPDDIIDSQRRYNLARVAVSLEMKQAQEKKEEIKENLSSMSFHVKYHGFPDKKQSIGSIYSRNLESQKHILKLPDSLEVKATNLLKRDDQQRGSTSHKSKDNSKYLKLLQNYQMEDRIELTLDRVLLTFFKPEINKKQHVELKPSAEEEYDLILEEDILKRHGRLEIQLPINACQQEPELLSVLNMRNQQYEINIRGLKGFWRVARKQTLLFVSNSLYDNFILLIVLANTILMCLSGFVDTDSQPYYSINLAFTSIFTVDLTVKVYAYGLSFFSDIMNVFDTGVAIISMVEISLGGSTFSALRSIRILRAFRVLRITRLIRSLNYMRIIMNVITSVINEFIYVFLLLFLFIFIYTLLGMQIFGGTFVPQSISGVRQNYDTFFNGFFTIFQVMTIQNWNDIQTATALSSIGPWGIIFLISWIFLGNWILLSLLQAILLDGFDNDSTNPEEQAASVQTQIRSSQIPQPAQSQEQLLSQEQSEQQSEINESDMSTKKSLNFQAEDASLFIFKPANPARRFAIYISNSAAFEVVVFIIILLSSAKLAVDTYIEEGSTGDLAVISQYVDFALNFIFIFESSMKIISRGFVIGQEAYLRNSWNRLDFFIVCISVIDMALSGVNLSIIKLLRTLRPLRIITKNEDMKVMITSLTQSILGILNLLIIVMCVYLMFGILGINLLQGKLQFCNVNGNNITTGNYGPYNIDQESCIAQGGAWTTQLINFQNIVNSMLSLYVFSTRENWPFYVFTFIDGTETGPVQDNSQILYFVYTIIFIFICSLFLMDLLVGVLFTNYHETESKIRPKTLSDKQINWKNLQKLIIQENPCFQLYIAPEGGFRKVLFSIVSSGLFQIFITTVILFNIIVMCIGNDDIPLQQEDTLSTLNSVCSYIFIVELTIKLLTFGKAYFLSVWNIFDFFIVAASLIDIILHYSGTGSSKTNTLSLLPQIARIFRVLRITRLLRMVKRFKGLQKLIQTFVFSLPAISKAFSILFLYLFIASILASNLMGGLYGDYSGSLSETINYSDFHHAIQLLFINLSGQNWYYYMFFSTSQGYAQCETSSCTSPFYYIFWLPFQFFGQKVFLELFVLVVLDQFEQNYIRQHNPLGIFSLYQQNFRQQWIKHTTKYRSQKIQTKHLINLMLALRAPLGLSRQETLSKYKEELSDNDKLTPAEIQTKINEMDQKLKKNAAILLTKMNLTKNRIYFGYHETFYHFIKLATVPQFVAEATPEQLKLMEQTHKASQQALDKLKPEGNLFYYGQLQDEDEKSEPLNPISLILFTQMIVKGWYNYSLRGKKAGQANDKEYNQFDSLNQSCASELNQAQFERIAPEKRMAIRRGGLIENKLTQKCEFQPAEQICGAYEDGKKKKTKISLSRLSNKMSTSKQSIRNRSKQVKFNLKGSQGRSFINRQD